MYVKFHWAKIERIFLLSFKKKLKYREIVKIKHLQKKGEMKDIKM